MSVHAAAGSPLQRAPSHSSHHHLQLRHPLAARQQLRLGQVRRFPATQQPPVLLNQWQEQEHSAW